MELNRLIEEALDEVSVVIKRKKEEIISRDDLSNITYGQFQFLYAIETLEEPTITNLANHMDLAKPTVTLAINSLVASGLVCKERSTKDKRVLHIRLTEKGIQLRKAERMAYDEMARAIQEKLSEEEYETFRAMLEKIVR